MERPRQGIEGRLECLVPLRPLPVQVQTEGELHPAPIQLLPAPRLRVISLPR